MAAHALAALALLLAVLQPSSCFSVMRGGDPARLLAAGTAQKGESLDMASQGHRERHSERRPQVVFDRAAGIGSQEKAPKQQRPWWEGDSASAVTGTSAVKARNGPSAAAAQARGEPVRPSEAASHAVSAGVSSGKWWE